MYGHTTHSYVHLTNDFAYCDRLSSLPGFNRLHAKIEISEIQIQVYKHENSIMLYINNTCINILFAKVKCEIYITMKCYRYVCMYVCMLAIKYKTSTNLI